MQSPLIVERPTRTWDRSQRRRMAILMALRDGDAPKDIASRFGVDIHTVYNVRTYGLLPRSCRVWQENGIVYCDDGSEVVTWRSDHIHVLARYAR